MSAAQHGVPYQPSPACTLPAKMRKVVEGSSRLTAEPFRGRGPRLQAKAKLVRSLLQSSRKERQS